MSFIYVIGCHGDAMKERKNSKFRKTKSVCGFYEKFGTFYDIWHNFQNVIFPVTEYLFEMVLILTFRNRFL